MVLCRAEATVAAGATPAQRRAASAVRMADDKAEVEEYFNNEGFNRWNKIYSESDEVNKVQLDIRNGHQQTVDKILDWTAGMDMTGKTVCDAGCGTGSLAIPLALRGAAVSAYSPSCRRSSLRAAFPRIAVCTVCAAARAGEGANGEGDRRCPSWCWCC